MRGFLKLSAPLLLVALQSASAQIGSGLTLAEAPMPHCDDPGQNDPYQGRSLYNKATGVCDKINICHGTGAEANPWIKITVSRSAEGGTGQGQGGLPGHTGFEHNEYDGVTGKRPDYYPSTYSVPNPNGAGNTYGSIDEGCNFIPYVRSVFTERRPCLTGAACST